MTLYHGSYIAVTSPLVKVGRKMVDFGQGFYLTKLREQAGSQAKTIAERKGRMAKPVLSTFEFDHDTLINAGYRVKQFEVYDLEWLDYVVDCRQGGDMQKMYDVVEVVSQTIM